MSRGDRHVRTKGPWFGLGWLEVEVADLYSTDKGRPGVAPEVAVRLMLAGLLLGIVHDRRLMREAQVNLAIRWFLMMPYAMHKTSPGNKEAFPAKKLIGTK